MLDLILKVVGIVGIVGVLAYLGWTVRFVTKLMAEYNELLDQMRNGSL